MTDLADATRLSTKIRKAALPRTRSLRPHAPRLRLLTESELDGNCRGWEGDTAFTLCNGEVWEQAAFRVRRVYLASPGVRIWRLGEACLLEIEGARELLPVRLRA